MCLNPKYCPDDNVTYPCMECDECKRDKIQTKEMNEINYLLSSLENKFGIDSVKPYRKRHGKHNKPMPIIEEDDDDLPF